MKHLFMLTVALASVMVARAGETKHIDDVAGMLRVADASKLDGELDQLQNDTGIRAVLRFHEHLPAPEEDDAPGLYMRGLSTQLGLIENGVLAVYFADEKEWRVWIGNALAARFAGQQGSAEALTKSGAMHDAKEAWMEQVFAAAEKAWAEWNQIAHGLPRPEEKVRFDAQALVDGLKSKFMPQE